MIDYATLNELAKKLGRTVESLLVLAGQNDPFYADRPGRRAAGEWFAGLWNRFGFGAGTHLRRIHYHLISSRTPVLLPNGMSYTNTTECWVKLLDASKNARCLRLVDPADFVDRRNAEADIAELRERVNATIHVSGRFDSHWSAPHLVGIEENPPDLPYLFLGSPVIPQRFVVEIWVEKSTVNDVLIPLQRRYGINIAVLTGEASDTRCQELVDRAEEHQRPVRILYVSDFDPAGQSMPVAVARKIEHRVRHDGLALDIQVRPIALTFEQCEQYRLPRTPIKASEARGARFEERYGAGATELDALEALHPGELRRILEREIRRYYDSTLGYRVAEVADYARMELHDVNRRVLASTEIDDLRREWQALAGEYNAAVLPIAERFQSRFDDIADRFNVIHHDVVAQLAQQAPAIDEYEWPEPDPGDEDPDPLFDSTREYVTQVDRYHLHQDRTTPPTQPRASGEEEAA
jgi:hypothetical protein